MLGKGLFREQEIRPKTQCGELSFTGNKQFADCSRTILFNRRDCLLQTNGLLVK